MNDRLSQADVDRAWLSLTRAATRAGRDTDEWTLVPGTDETGAARTPWIVTDQTMSALLHLGYTRRQAFDAMQHMTAVLLVVTSD